MNRLTAEQALRRDEERQQQEALMNVKRQSTFAFVSRAQLDAQNPSLKSGLSPAKVMKWHRQMCIMLQRAGMSIKM